MPTIWLTGFMYGSMPVSSIAAHGRSMLERVELPPSSRKVAQNAMAIFDPKASIFNPTLAVLRCMFLLVEACDKGSHGSRVDHCGSSFLDIYRDETQGEATTQDCNRLCRAVGPWCTNNLELGTKLRTLVGPGQGIELNTKGRSQQMQRLQCENAEA